MTDKIGIRAKFEYVENLDINTPITYTLRLYYSNNVYSYSDLVLARELKITLKQLWLMIYKYYGDLKTRNEEDVYDKDLYGISTYHEMIFYNLRDIEAFINNYLEPLMLMNVLTEGL